MTTDADTLQKIYDAIQSLETKLEAKYVSKDRFKPVERIVYGLVSLILIAVIGSMIGMVVVDSGKTNAINTTELKK